MKIEWNKKYTTIAVYAFLVIAVAFLFIMSIIKFVVLKAWMKNIFGVLKPFIIGAIIAYIMNFLVRFIENVVLGKTGAATKLGESKSRKLSILASYIVILLIAVAFANYVLPGIVGSITQLINDTPEYVRQTTKWITENIDKLNLNGELDQSLKEVSTNFFDKFKNILADVLPKMGGFAKGLMSGITNFILGFIISVYMMLEKERFRAQSKMVMYSVFPRKFADYMIELMGKMNQLIKRYLAGQGLDALIVGISFYVILKLMKLKYAEIMAIILGFTNMIPWIGPLIGTLPSAIIILFQSPVKTIWFLVSVLIIQQVDGNIIAPRIHGENLGVSAFWIVFAILIGGNLFGLPGMVLGIPVFVLIYSLIREFVEKRLNAKHMPITSEAYKDYGPKADSGIEGKDEV